MPISQYYVPKNPSPLRYYIVATNVLMNTNESQKNRIEKEVLSDSYVPTTESQTKHAEESISYINKNNLLQAKIKELEAALEQRKIENVKFEEKKSAALSKEIETLKDSYETKIIALANQLHKQKYNLEKTLHLEQKRAHIRNLFNSALSIEERLKIEKSEKEELQTVVQSLSAKLEEKSMLEIEFEELLEQARYTFDLKKNLENKVASLIEDDKIRQAKLEELEVNNLAVLVEKNQQNSEIKKLKEALRESEKQLGYITNCNNILQEKIVELEKKEYTNVQQVFLIVDAAHNISTLNSESKKSSGLSKEVEKQLGDVINANQQGSLTTNLVGKIKDEKPVEPHNLTQNEALKIFFKNLEQRAKTINQQNNL